jgi:hypothetical protein
MIFTLLSIFVPVLLYLVLPRLVERSTGKAPASNFLLTIAGLLFFLSWHLPSPEIRGESTAFSTHFVGGGIFTGFVWLYLSRELGWRLNWAQDLIGLFFLVSGLGVANELFEFAVVEAGLVQLSPSDTWWDLLANTSGALALWVAHALYVLLKPQN